MKSVSRLTAALEMLERNAAAAARLLAADLMRPTPDRDDLVEHSVALTAALVAAREAAERLRQLHARGRTSERQDLRPLFQRLDQWEMIARAVEDCLAGTEWPLMPDPPRLDLAGAQGALVSGVFNRAHHAINPAPQDRAAAERGAFRDVPLDTARFVAATHLAYRLHLARKAPRPWRFLDVGCGGGVKLMLAAEFFDECVGIELDPGYVVAARQGFDAMRAQRCQVVMADALEFGHYGGFDVIYVYQPMHDLDELVALERKIVADSGPEVILIAPYQGFALRAAGLGCVGVDGMVFMKDSSDNRLAELVEEARRMGPHVVSADEDPPPGLGWMRALWLACAANGIRPG